MKTIATLALLLLLLACPVAAQVRYKDDEGITHWVNSIDEVPQKYRAGATGKPVSSPKAPLSPSDPDYWEQKNKDNEWAAGVRKCTQATNYSGVFGADSFKAYVPEPGRVKMVGSAQARYQFEKCMNEAGQRFAE